MDVSRILSVASEMRDTEARFTNTQDMEELLSEWEADLREAVLAPNEVTGGTDFDMVAEGEGEPADMENQIADVDARVTAVWDSLYSMADRVTELERKARKNR